MRALALLAALIIGAVTFADTGEIPQGSPESVGMSSERLARIAPAMQRYIDDRLTPGVITAIVRKGKLVHLSVQGDMDVEVGQQLRPDASFDLFLFFFVKRSQSLICQ